MIKKRELRIKGLHCANCVAKIEKSMSSVPGIYNIKISFSTSKMEVEYDPDKTTLDHIQSKIKNLGYKLLEEEEVKEEKIFSLENREFVFTIISGIALCFGLSISFLTPDPVILEFYHHIILSASSRNSLLQFDIAPQCLLL